MDEWLRERERALLSNDNYEINVQMGTRLDFFMRKWGESTEPPEGRIFMSIDKKYFATLSHWQWQVENTSPGIK